MLHNYIDEISAKIKAQQRYREVELIGSYFCNSSGRKKLSRKRLEQIAEVHHFYIIDKNISLRLGG